jgi:hypothetical protein
VFVILEYIHVPVNLPRACIIGQCDEVRSSEIIQKFLNHTEFFKSHRSSQVIMRAFRNP